MSQEGQFTIPTRLYLDPVERAKLETLLHEQDRELPELLTEIVSQYLAGKPDPVFVPPPAPPRNRAQEAQRRRNELQRLRARVEGLDTAPLPWMVQYVADLEAEVSRLERGA
ncbi:MAG: hypothetical protein MUD01_28730 [Chloroflexaceae bacterium]|jgi:hypothetical protein|nr:hypothetical protein [Chloroflexaceae bacterium]